jgi:hypothetical protein
VTLWFGRAFLVIATTCDHICSVLYKNFGRAAATQPFELLAVITRTPLQQGMGYIYISLQLCKMNEARASHINANQGTIKAVNTSKLNSNGMRGDRWPVGDVTLRVSLHLGVTCRLTSITMVLK